METNQLLNLSASQLRQAAELKERIEELNDELGNILNETSASASLAGGEIGNGRRGAGRRRMSVEGRRRIAEATRARWAKLREAKGQSPKSSTAEIESGKKRRTMSAAARKKIAAAARARWAKIRAAKGQG